MYSVAHPSSPCNSCPPPLPVLQHAPRPAANLTTASQLHTARNLHASHQLVHATRGRPESPVPQSVVMPLSQASTLRRSAVAHRGKAKCIGHDTGAGVGAAASPATGWSEVVTLDLLPPCLQLLRQGQVTEALDLLQQLTMQHGPPDRDVGDTILLVRLSSQTCSIDPNWASPRLKSNASSAV